MQGIGAVIMVCFGKVAQLLDQRVMRGVQADAAVFHMGLQGLDAQQLIRMGNDGQRRNGIAQRRLSLDRLGAQELLKLHRLDPPYQAMVVNVQFDNVADYLVRQSLVDVGLTPHPECQWCG